jgi:hypothetical protein
MPSNAVLILRSPKDPNNSTSDPYSTSFKSHSYDPYFLNVLETTWSEEDTLRNAIVAGPGDRYGGVIITSQNAAEAWNRVVLAEEEERVERGRPRRRNEAGVDMAGMSSLDLPPFTWRFTHYYYRFMVPTPILRSWPKHSLFPPLNPRKTKIHPSSLPILTNRSSRFRKIGERREIGPIHNSRLSEILDF